MSLYPVLKQEQTQIKWVLFHRCHGLHKCHIQQLIATAVTHRQVGNVLLYLIGKLVQQFTTATGIHPSPWWPQLEGFLGCCHCLVHISLHSSQPVNQSSQSTTALSTSACTVVNRSVTHSYQPLREEFTHNNRVHTRKVQGLEEEGPVSTESWYAKMWFNEKNQDILIKSTTAIISPKIIYKTQISLQGMHAERRPDEQRHENTPAYHAKGQMESSLNDRYCPNCQSSLPYKWRWGFAAVLSAETRASSLWEPYIYSLSLFLLRTPRPMQDQCFPWPSLAQPLWKWLGWTAYHCTQILLLAQTHERNEQALWFVCFYLFFLFFVCYLHARFLDL